MKKRSYLFIMLLVILIMCVAVGCGENEDPTKTEAGTYSISYYLTPDSSEEVEVSVPNSETFQMSIPQRMGYTFEGLYDQPDGGTQIVNDDGRLNIVLNKDLLLYAQWKPNSYTVYFDAGEGEIIGSDNEKLYEYGSDILSFAIAEREGYDFLGWYHNGEQCSDAYGTPVSGKSVFNFDTYTQTGDVVILTAQWEKKMLTVTFDFNDGSYNYQEMKVGYGETISLADFPVVDTGSKELVGWAYTNNTNTVIESDLTNIRNDLRVYGVWRDYKIVQFLEQDDKVVEVRVYSDAPYTVHIPERHGYEFDGWYESKSFAGNPVENIFYFDGKDVYYAKWNMATYSITFQADNDCVGDTATKYYTIEDDVLLPMLTKDHYVFLGWCRNEDLSDTPMQLLEAGNSGDITLYAKFKGEDCYVTLDAKDGSDVPASFAVEYGTVGTIPVPTISDYAFGGWFLEDGTQFTDKNGVMLQAYLYDEEPVLVAKYVRKYYITVDIPYSAGTVEIGEYYIEGDQVILKFVQTDNGYTFGGFYDGANKVAAGKTHGFYMPASDVNLKIVLTPQEFEVGFDVDGGYQISNTYKLKYKENFILPIAYKVGYVFTGWSVDGNMVTDAEGKSLGPWSHASNATLKANYQVDTSGNAVQYIGSREDFVAIANNPSGKYVLVSDLDFTGYQFASVPELKGVLDGNGHTITGNTVALFDKVSGTIKNLNIVTDMIVTINDNTNCSMLAKNVTGTVVGVTTRGSITIRGAFGQVGAIAGQITGGGTIQDCINYANITADHSTGDAGTVGGVVGYLDNSVMTNCKNYGNITGDFRVGGVVGLLNNSNNFSDCENHGKIVGENHTGGVAGRIEFGGRNITFIDLTNTADVTGKENTGGIAGSIYCNCDNGSNYTVTATGLNNSGAIIGTKYVAGVAGYVSINNRWYNMSLQASELTNTANVTGDYYVGGLLGYGWVDSASEIANSSSSGAIYAKAIVGGLAGWLDYIKVTNCSNAGTTFTVTGYHMEGSVYQAFVGGYVGRAYAIEGCTNEANIQYTEKGSYVGGIAGWSNGDIINCKNTGTVSAAKADHVGGILGRLEYVATNMTMTDLTNNGAVSGKENTGGIVGSVYCNCDSGANYTMTMNTLNNSGAVSGTKYAAGVAGYVYINNKWYNMILQGSEFTNTGDVTGDYYVAGLVGYSYVDSASELSDSKSSGAITAKAIVGGLAGWLENVKLSNCDNTGTTISATGYHLDGTSYYAYVGGYVGYGSAVDNCTNTASISYAEKGNYVGGVAGYANGNITNCHNAAAVSAAKAQYVGGVVGGINYGAKNSSLTDLSNSGSVTAKDSVGGIIGSLKYACSEYTDYILTVSNLNNTGNVVGIQYVGGVVGYCHLNNSRNAVMMQAAEMSNTSNVTGDTYVGGLFGYAYSDGSSQITESTSSSSLMGNSYVGGIAGYLENVKIEDCENTGTQIEAENKGSHIGGYVGLTNSAISGCSNAVTITALKADYVGGIAGQISYGAKNLTLEDLTNSAEISANNYVGGIVGSLNCSCSEYTDYTLTATNLQNTGAVSGVEYVAGIAGRCYLDNGRNSVFLQASQLTNNANATGDTYVGGLFGHVYTDGISQIADSTSSGTIKATSYLGGIAGKLENTAVVDCQNAGTQIKANGKGTHIGGFVGFTNYNISGCTNAASISASKSDYIGGIAGQISYGARNITLEELSNSGSITGKEYVGGIVGSVNCSCSEYTDYKLTLSALSNSGAVTGTKYAGGIVGYCYLDNGRYTVYFHASSLSNTGDITSDYYVGGLFGYAYTDGASEISESSSSGAITAKAYIGGLGGWLQNVKLNDCSNAGTTISATGSFANGNAYDAYVGGYAGRGYIIQGCTNKAHISYNDKGRYVGGIAGYVDGDVTDCKNYGIITAAKADYVGGIAGALSYGAKSVNLKELSNAGSITGKDYVGGIVGSITGSCSEYTDYILSVDSLTNTSPVSGEKNVAGLIGYCNLNNGRNNMYMKATNMVNRGHINGTTEVGGLIGFFSSDGASTLSDFTTLGNVYASEGTHNLMIANGKNITLQ